MLSKLKRTKYQQHLAQLPKIPQSADDVQTLHSPALFRTTLTEQILQAKKRIYLVALYLEHDDGGEGILSALYQAKRQCPELEIVVLVDWHRAQRGRIGVAADSTNADWYYEMAQRYDDAPFPIYGVPVNTREALGVLHLKGFIIDDTVLYSGASLNDVYLHQHEKYRYDRYQLIHNPVLADVTYWRRPPYSGWTVRLALKPSTSRTISASSVSHCVRQLICCRASVTTITN